MTLMPAEISLDAALARPWPCVIVGAGPAGSTAALVLARRGVEVLLVDRSAFPREKVCGDGLIPDALRLLERLGLMEEVLVSGRAMSEALVFSHSRRELHLPGRFVTVKRVILDDLLRRAAMNSGAAALTAKVLGLSGAATEAPEVSVESGALRARAVIIATGAQASVLKGVLPAKPHPQGIAAALRFYVTSPVEIPHLVISYDRTLGRGYGWIFPLRDGEYNVGCGIFAAKAAGRPPDLKALLARFLASSPLASALMAAAVHQTPPKGAPIWSGLQAAPPLAGPRVLCAGEVTGTTFPFTGEGIGKAMETGEMAAESVAEFLGSGHDEAIPGYARRIASRLAPKYRGYRTAERWLSRPWLSDLLAWRVSRSPRFAGYLAGILSESSDPSEVFSLYGVMRSFFG